LGPPTPAGYGQGTRFMHICPRFPTLAERAKLVQEKGANGLDRTASAVLRDERVPGLWHLPGGDGHPA
jgi:hypothetical protein